MSSKRKSSWRARDPYRKREEEKYGVAIPSREFLTEFLTERGVPVTHVELCEGLGIDDEWGMEAVRRRLRAMVRDGQLICNRRGGYGIIRKMDLIPGRVVGHQEGFGFLVPDEGGEDLYLSAREMRELIHGDRAAVRVVSVDQRGRREGALVEVLERNTVSVVGRFSLERGLGYVVPDNRRISQEIEIPAEHQMDAADGQIVSAEIIGQPTRRRPPIGRIVEVLGNHMAPGMEVEISLRAHAIPTAWPEDLQAEIEGLGAEVAEADKRDRVDLRSLPLVTIDGVDSRDFDDAVYCERRGRNWRLVVAIADVASYVKPMSALDREARNRGNSVYFPDRVIPMLPEVLSNGLCSLNPNVDRLCMACDMSINAEGRIVRSRFVEAVMRSHARLTYDAVAAILVDRDAGLRRDMADLVPHLDNLFALYQVLREARETRGAIDFETQETVIEYGADGKIERIRPTERNDAHKVIEECMIAANVAAARLLQRNRMPAVYRVHEGPSMGRLETLRAFLGELGLGLGGGDKPTPMDYAQLLHHASDRPDAHLIQTVLLRSLARAVYSPAGEGHFGLALPAYTHFTSPIRRYPDLLVHRGIRHLLRGGKARDFIYGMQDMDSLGEHCSMTERRADESVWDAIEWLKCEYMLDKVGEEFDGIVTTVTSFGLFVELKDVFVEGLIHVTALANDYYHFDRVGHRLQGERSGKVYRIGDPVRVSVAKVNLDERKIDFEPVGPVARTSNRKRRGGFRRRKKSS